MREHLKFPIVSHPRGSYNHHIVVRVDTGADVNCMNKKTFNELFPEVQLSVCPHEIQNFGNLVADISILGQFRTYLEFRGEMYLNTFIVTNANDCPNLLSCDATFRMGVLIPNYPKDIMVKGENVPNFSRMSGDKKRNSTTNGTLNSTSNVFQILGDIQKQQFAVQSQYNSHSSRADNSFQDHHTLCTSTDNSDSKAGRSSACKCTPCTKYFTEWTSSTLCTCPQGPTSGSETRRCISLEKSPVPAQLKDLCEQIPTDKARHSVTLFW